MEEKQKLTSEQLENELKSRKTKSLLAKILTYGCGLLTILLFAMNSYVAAVICLVLTFVGGYQMSKQDGAIKTLLGDNVIKNLINEVFDGAEYAPFKHIDTTKVTEAGMVFPFEYDSVNGSDYIKGSYKGLDVELSDIELRKVDTRYDETAQQWKDEEQLVFKGQWLICDFGKELSGEIHISDGAKKLRKQHKNDSVEMENTAFNDRFLVTSDDAHEAYYILTPHMMEYILTMAGKSGGEVYMAFLRGGKLHIAVKTERDFFELGKTKTNIDELSRKFREEIKWFTDIIDVLRVEDTLYKKEREA